MSSIGPWFGSGSSRGSPPSRCTLRRAVVRSQNRNFRAERRYVTASGDNVGSAGAERADGGQLSPQAPTETIRTDSDHSVLGVASRGRTVAWSTWPVIPTLAITESKMAVRRFYAARCQTQGVPRRLAPPHRLPDGCGGEVPGLVERLRPTRPPESRGAGRSPPHTLVNCLTVYSLPPRIRMP